MKNFVFALALITRLMEIIIVSIISLVIISCPRANFIFSRGAYSR